MESLIDVKDDWMFPWEAAEMSGQQGSSGLLDLSSACSESPWLEGIDVWQSTKLLSQSSEVDSKDDFTFDPFQPFSEVFFLEGDSSSFVDSPPSMSPETLNYEPFHLYEKDVHHYTEYDIPSPEYAIPSPPAGYVPSSDYASSSTGHHSPALEYSPQYQLIADCQIQSPVDLNLEDLSSDILAVLSDQHFTLLSPESELLPACNADHRFSSSAVFGLPLFDESSRSPFVQEVPEEPVGFEADLEEVDSGLLEEGPENVYMKNILEELIGAPELLSPVSSDDVESILSASDSLNLTPLVLPNTFPHELNLFESERATSYRVLPTPSDFLLIVDSNPSSCDSASVSSYDGGSVADSVPYVSGSYKYTTSSNRVHSETPYARPDRRLKKMEQNKTAALRYRHKKREQKGVALTEVEQLEQRNTELKNRAADLTREITYLKGLMDEICKT